MCVRREAFLLPFVFEHRWLCSPSATVKTTTQEQQGEENAKQIHMRALESH